jgi:ferredoxin
MRIRSITGLVFSPTGGCLKIARSLRESLDAYEVEIHNITKPVVRERLLEISKTTDYLFVIFPVYADTLPDIVAEYLGRLRVSGIPVTIIAGYGNIYPGNALVHARVLLEAKGNTVCSACTVVTAHSYSGDAIRVGIGEPSSEHLKVFQQFVRDSIDKVERAARPGLCRVDLPEGRVRLRSRPPQRLLPQMFIRQPRVLEERCSHCEVCIDMCPSAAIGRDLTIDNGRCIRCLACVKYCKADARVFETRTQLLPWILTRDGRAPKQNSFYV